MRLAAKQNIQRKLQNKGSQPKQGCIRPIKMAVMLQRFLQPWYIWHQKQPSGIERIAERVHAATYFKKKLSVVTKPMRIGNKKGYVSTNQKCCYWARK